MTTASDVRCPELTARRPHNEAVQSIPWLFEMQDMLGEPTNALVVIDFFFAYNDAATLTFIPLMRIRPSTRVARGWNH